MNLPHIIDKLLRRRPKEKMATLADFHEIQFKCMQASAHEDQLFYEYVAKKNGEFDLAEFYEYARDNWKLEYDPYGYRKAREEQTSEAAQLAPPPSRDCRQRPQSD